MSDNIGFHAGGEATPAGARHGQANGYIDRRLFLGGALAVGVGLFSASCSGPKTIAKALRTPPAGSDLGAIEHVVFLMQENRSFDHYFGRYRGVRGFDDHPAGDLGSFSQKFEGNTSHAPAGRLLPFRLNTASTIGECTFDLSHDWTTQHQCWSQGKMDSFARIHTSATHEGAANGVLTMGYYQRDDLAYHYGLADAFTICDAYHSSVLGPTHPNRLMSISGTIDPQGTHGGPILITDPSPDARFSVNWTTMPEILEDAGISWKVYTPPGPLYRVESPEVLWISDAILPYFAQYRRKGSALYQKAFQPTFPETFLADIRSDSLPAVSWIIPPLGYDEHPPAPPALGAYFIDQVIRALVSSPSIWSKTVLLLSYDENDGFFDHVKPPVAPLGTPGEYLRSTAPPQTSGGITGPIGLGMRVPMLVISPFSRGGYVCSETFDHTSQLRFLEERFAVTAPNISAWRRKTVGDLTATLQMNSPDNSALGLPTPAGWSPANLAALGCGPLDVQEADSAQAPYPLPSVQSMPTQEPGTPRRNNRARK